MTSKNLVLLTLLPTAPRKPEDFVHDLEDLEITVYDLTVKDSKAGVPLGTAKNPTQDPWFRPIEIEPATATEPAKLKNSILIQFDKVEVTPPFPQPDPVYIGVPHSVATAVIVVEPPPPGEDDFEYDSSDLRIVITRNNKVLKGFPTLEFNAPVRTIAGDLPTDPQTYIDLDYDLANDPGRTNPLYRASYCFIPPKPNATGNRAVVEISDDGVTPVLSSLISGVNEVLAADHTSTKPGEKTSLQERTNPLTNLQCKQVAKELIYDRIIYPLPKPKNKTLEDMYKDPDVDVSHDQDRKQFEADLVAYHATHDAEATSLAGYIRAASTAIECERLSLQATSTSFPFDVVTGAVGPKTILPTVQVVLDGVEVQPDNPQGHLDPTFGVPAAYFFALSSLVADSVEADERYRAATIQREDASLKLLQFAQDVGIIAASENALTSSDPFVQGLNIDQAARRLSALGGVNGSLRRIDLTDAISTIVSHWLNNPGKTDDIQSFWVSEAGLRSDEYLELLLEVIVEEKTDLKKEIKTVLNVKKASDLPPITDKGWLDFFVPPGSKETDPLAIERAALLPAYTGMGKIADRANAFVFALKRLLSVGTETVTSDGQNPNDVPVFTDDQRDALRYFLEASPNFSFADDIVEATVTSTIESLPMSPELQKWTNRAVHTIHFLYKVTNLPDTTTHPKTLQFSLMEALYARGFISADRIALLTQDQFQAALAGTIAYHQDTAGGIYNLATPLSKLHPDPGPEPGNGFKPINAGDLVDCIPPPNLSPLGLIQYLHELLELKVLKLPSSDAANGAKPTEVTLLDVVSARRGPVGTMKTTLTNLELCLPRIDLVNESLEALAKDISTKHGAVSNTNPNAITDLFPVHGEEKLDPEKTLLAIPQNSSPAVPVAALGVYTTLSTDCSSAQLPYSQELDINRTYLRALGASRFDVMRSFRKAITEFVLQPNDEPAEFQSNLWRFPVRYDVAIEYLLISEDERELLYTNTPTGAALAHAYGFSPTDEGWEDDITSLPVFLERTGLTYCEFYDLWKSGFVKFGPRARNKPFPACEPCCLTQYSINFNVGEEEDNTIPLQKLVVFIRLWHKVEQHLGKCCLSFTGFGAICQALCLFDSNNNINHDFLRQLIALLMLCDVFCLPLCEEQVLARPEETPRPEQYVRILALWTASCEERVPNSAKELLLDGIEKCTNREHECKHRGPEFKKILIENFDQIAELAGFDENHPWSLNPSCTLRFAEILSKIWASTFTVGEILFLFTNSEHLTGDDPFPWTEESEAEEDPLNAPEDSKDGVWKLRERLRRACVEGEEVKCWSWQRIEQSLRKDFGLVPPQSSKQVDPLAELGEHFFPGLLESCGHSVPAAKRHFATTLHPADTSAMMWDTPPHGPFHYRSSSSELWIELPLRDEDVLEKLSHLRQLRSPAELKAVQQLYFAPRAVLAPFTLIFGSLSEAIDHMVQGCSELKRFEYFQHAFALFHKRCEIIAEHLAEHVALVTDICEDGERRPCNIKVAWEIIKSLTADENTTTERWEVDSGESPEVNTFAWDPKFSGSTFAALLGVIGIGLLGEYSCGDTRTAWKEIRSPLLAFGKVLDQNNVPVPTIIPALDATPKDEQRDVVMFRNGFAFSDLNSHNLGGAQQFRVKWEGVLLVEKYGEYRFHSHRPSYCKGQYHKALSEHDDHDEGHGSDKYHGHSEHNHDAHDHSHDHSEEHKKCNCCDKARWIVTLRRGQKKWTLLSHNWPSSDHVDRDESLPIHLSKHSYDIEVCFEETEPAFPDEEGEERLQRAHTGFGVKYCGPDTSDKLCIIPLDKLFIKCKTGPLAGDGDHDKMQDTKFNFLRWQYTSSLRDIRRSYQRAFKAILFAHRFCLSSEPEQYCDNESELKYILQHPVQFQGTSYYKYYDVAKVNDSASSDAITKAAHCGSFKTHHANFDFNFLPVNDAYIPPNAGDDSREDPSDKRIRAMFDWWERIFDYKRLAAQVEQSYHPKQCRGPLWQLFHEADVQNPSNAAGLLRHLRVDLGLAPLTLTYLDNVQIGATELTDERWPIRVWHAWAVLQGIQKAVYTKQLETARPDLWSSAHPNLVVDATSTPPLSANGNLVHLAQESYLLDSKIQRFEVIEKLNNGLRMRARKALVAYLCAVGRVVIDISGKEIPATSSKDLSALLLQDVDTGLCERSTRIEDAICAVHTFVQRLRLGLEPTFLQPSPRFTKKWDSTFSTFETWQIHQRRVLYKENWIQWEELQVARQSQAFSFFEKNLDCHSLSMPVAQPPFTLTMDSDIPQNWPPEMTQYRDFATFRAGNNPVEEGIDLIGSPGVAGQPSWLSTANVPAPAILAPPDNGEGGGEGGGNGGENGGGTGVEGGPLLKRLPVSKDQVNIPLWFQAAVKLGTTFIRIAAASMPPAFRSNLRDETDDDNSTSQQDCHCGKPHAPVMDEFYFWLVQGEYFDSEDAPQNADLGVAFPDPTTDWERDSVLPKLLHWPARSVVHLHWTRVHMGTFSPPRRCAEGIPFVPGSDDPSLEFEGRKFDSLVFGAVSSTGLGFRYDLATDAAAVSPQVIPSKFPQVVYPTPLPAYPYFIYAEPGAPLVPTSSFGTVLSVAGSLRTQCKFEQALAWCKVAFNPLERNNTWPQCPQLGDTQPASNDASKLKKIANEPVTESDVKDSLQSTDQEHTPIQIDIPCCPTTSVQTAMARSRAIALEYIRVLLQWGDTLMCVNRKESIDRALILYNEATRLLGPKPGFIKTQESGIGELQTVEKYRSLYAAINPKLKHLYDEAYSRQELIQNCLSSRMLVGQLDCKKDTCSMDTCNAIISCTDEQVSCCKPYRFSYYLGKALELAGMVKGLGNSLLSALEKGDAEYLAALRQTHEVQMNQLMLSNKQAGYREADWQVQALEKQIEGALVRHRYNTLLLKNGLNSGETAYVSGTNMALGSRTASSISEGIGQGITFIPDIIIGGAGAASSPVEVNQLPLGSKLAQVFQAAARIMNVVGDNQNTNAGLGSTTGGWDRRADDWAHQVDVITLELAQLKRQELAAERRRDMALRDLNNHQDQIQNLAEIEDFLRDKISKQDLYLFLQQETVGLYRRGFDIAQETAREAQQAFQYERRDLDVELPIQSWDNLHAGLMAGEKLEMSLRLMEQQYMRTNCREYELSKHLSLRLHFPFAFLQLKTLGWCELEVPEWMFDLDYPGHYMRRIKNVSVTIPCVVGPYTGVHCRLQLLSSGIRLSPSIPTEAKCCCTGKCTGDETCAYDSYEGLSRQFMASEAISTSTGQTDSGLFELNFRDERLVPFEFAGAVSRWRIELPPENNLFDLDSLSDFVIHLSYTAREGGPLLRRVANKSAQCHLPGDGVRFFDIRHEFPTLWASAFARRHDPRNSKHNRKHENRISLQFSRRGFPFLTGRRSITLSNLHLYVEVDKHCTLGGHFPVHFQGVGECKEDKKFTCVSTPTVPGLYHGILDDVVLGRLDDDDDHILGHLAFPHNLREAHVRQAYFVCYYAAGEPRGKKLQGPDCEDGTSFPYTLRAKPGCSC
ncbi:hypothetical protein B0O99DRAFT_669787 [Bisporella sp. PMI_857]|nr:hypothetical protein B0O99DRAFT_669787 [Bisporella sp. PMI_857]